MGALAAVSSGSDLVGVSADKLTVPIESVTVSEASVTASESDLLRSSDEDAVRKRLISIIRGKRPESERLAAFNRLWDQDDIFYLFFKPGEDRNVAVRVAAVNRLAEADLLRMIGERTNIPEVTEAIKNRINALYADDRDRRESGNSTVSLCYISRLRSRK